MHARLPQWSLEEVYNLSQQRTQSRRLLAGLDQDDHQANPLVEEVSTFLARIEVQFQRIHEQR